MKIFFDTNVYAAEALLGRAAEQMLEATLKGSWRIYTSTFVGRELERVLTEVFDFPRRLAVLSRKRMLRRATVVEPAASRHTVPDDPDDSEMGGAEGLAAARERRDFWPIAAWSVCTTFLPDPEDETYLCDPPYRVERGELIPVPEVVDRFREALPIHAASRHLAALRSLRGLALDYGLWDQFSHIPDTTQTFSDVLAELGVAHELSVYEGDHRQEVGERLETVVLPWISRLLDRPSP